MLDSKCLISKYIIYLWQDKITNALGFKAASNTSSYVDSKDSEA